MTTIATITQETIENQIFTIRGKQVMLDRDLAVLYRVGTKVLNQAVKRNLEKFPDDFMFELTREEFETLRSQFVTSKNEKNLTSQNVILEKRGGARYLPTVFTEYGVAMLASVLRSETAVKVSVQIMRAFVEMRRFLKDNAEVFIRLDNMERKQFKADENFDKIFNALQSNDHKQNERISIMGRRLMLILLLLIWYGRLKRQLY
ncbi:ORF6N domain-containing protein [Pedobacter nutrimenti]|uniref:ORF6N domain-containing protein n=1 Tax=Pedobacter nutrimenti TaxID=1241337 RepID=UPI0029308D84|nr:ORF6N domain-containing protein [Pedobacter nutrimenti]